MNPPCPNCGCAMVLVQGNTPGAIRDLLQTGWVWWNCPNCGTCSTARRLPPVPRTGEGLPQHD